jgi:hypothetical protein
MANRFSLKNNRHDEKRSGHSSTLDGRPSFSDENPTPGGFSLEFNINCKPEVPPLVETFTSLE